MEGSVTDIAHLREPIKVKRSGFVKGASEEQDRQMLLARIVEYLLSDFGVPQRMKAARELTLYSNLASRLYSRDWPATESNGCEDWHVIAPKMCRLADSQTYD